MTAKDPHKFCKEYVKKTYPKVNVKKDIRRLVKENGIEFEKLCNDLSGFEKSNIVQTYKVGVLYWKENQTENEAFSNSSSENFDKFLEILGTKIQLRGWSKFRGMFTFI